MSSIHGGDKAVLWLIVLSIAGCQSCTMEHWYMQHHDKCEQVQERPDGK